MNFNIKIFLLCTIPEGQKPINEYINFNNNFLTRLIYFKEKNNYIKIYSFIFLLFFLFINSINFSSLLLKNVLITFFLSNFSFIIFYFNNLIKWKNLENRFNNSRIIYEEGSWYDSQIWEKPFLLIKTEKLIASQKIFPFVNQLSFNIFLFLISNFIMLPFFLIN